jgi:N-acetylmuramoyl-L-alanine amidase
MHIVKQGDCLNSIADRYGFFWDTIWNHERNAELREKRRDPNVIMAGDRVFVPEIRPREESGETTRVHVFRLKGVPVKLNLHIHDEFDKPRAGMKYTLVVDGKKTQNVVPEDGLISEVVQPQAKQASLTLETGEQWVLHLGNLNPVGYTSGVQARLKNLGYYMGDISGQLDQDTRKALRRFQAARGLEATGEADEATRGALEGTHAS